MWRMKSVFQVKVWYIIASEDSSSVSEIHAFIDGPEETPFYGGRFRMKLVLSEDYPNSPPKGYFLTKIYHPNIANNGDICVNTLKRDWNSSVTIKHILQAGELFMDSYEDFAARAKIMTEVHAIPVKGKVGKLCASSDEVEGMDSSVQKVKKEKDVKKKRP
eukprot:gene5228-5761_t